MTGTLASGAATKRAMCQVACFTGYNSSFVTLCISCVFTNITQW